MIFLVLSLVFVAAAIALARDRRRAVWALGVGAACAGVLLIVTLAVARSYVTGAFDGPDERAAAGAVWDSFLTDLRTAAWIMAASGAVVAAAAASLVRPGRARAAGAPRSPAGSPRSPSARGCGSRARPASWRPGSSC